MKKNFIRTAFVAVFALMAGYSVYTSQQKSEMSDLAMANVEALANGEQENGITCIGEGTVDCPIGIKVRAVIKYYSLE